MDHVDANKYEIMGPASPHSQLGMALGIPAAPQPAVETIAARSPGAAYLRLEMARPRALASGSSAMAAVASWCGAAPFAALFVARPRVYTV